MENTFLPSNYDGVPQTQSNYMKLEKGENKFRVMSSAIVGYEYWTTENKPVRSKTHFTETPNIKTDKNGKKSIKHFWAFVVWNYKTEKIEVMEITQATIQRAIEALVKNEDWGDPKTYDIIIKRSGEGIETEYSVMPVPHKDVLLEAETFYKEMDINLEALYTGDDPFAKKDANEADIDVSNII